MTNAAKKAGKSSGTHQGPLGLTGGKGPKQEQFREESEWRPE